MKLADNLKRIRKENNLSQEQLAEKLGVSRQAVSKWESEQSYPEMDKVLLMCKLFNYNIDELMNENVKEVDENKQSKINVNKYIEDFFAFITKTVDMISSMTMKQKLKCLVEQFIVGAILVAIFAIIGSIVYQIVSPNNIIGTIVMSKTILAIGNIVRSLYYIFALVIGTAILLHIFKIRYLDYYEIVRDNDKEDRNEESAEESSKNERAVEKDEKDTKKTLREKNKEKIIIRDPEHSESKFLNGILRVILGGIKVVVAFMSLGFIITFITFIALLVMSFLFVKTGLVFIGVLMGIISAILVNFIVLEICYNFIVSKKSKKTRMAITFLIALVLAGFSVGFIGIGITEFKYIENTGDSENFTETVFEFPMSMNLSIEDWAGMRFVETDSENIKIVVKHTKNSTIDSINANETITIHYNIKDGEVLQEIRDIIKDINNKEIRDYYPVIYVYASRENIDKLEANKIAKEKIDMEIQIDRLEDENERLQEKIDGLQEQLEEKEDEIENLRQNM